MVKLIDMAGQVFGKLTVLSRAASSGRTKWKCRCECGNITIQLGYDVREGKILSCGCHRRTTTGDRSRTHGQTNTKEYRAWINMKNRCNLPNVPCYSRYGAKGITICDQWQNSFETFLLDLGKCPPNCTLDRINPKGGYYPDNCRWASMSIQSNNKSRIRQITIDGKTQSVSQWCEELHLNKRTIRARIYEHGWEPVRAILEKVHKKSV